MQAPVRATTRRAKSDQGLDTRIEIITPENIAFEYRLAGPFSRLPAYLVDMVIRIGLLLLVTILAGVGFTILGASAAAWMIGLLVWFALEWFYGGLFEIYWNGQTPGKRMFGLRVVSLDGRPISAMQAILRNLLRAIDQQPLVTFQLGLIAAAMNGRFQRLGDLAAGTMVVVHQRQRLTDLARIDHPEARRLAEQLPAQFVVHRSLSQVLAKYADRRSQFSPSRRNEIAGRLGHALCQQLSLPPETDHDALLCALYQHAFLSPHSKMAGGPPNQDDAPTARKS
jgi:uncharacterized RDD family membrane protein YckC